MDSTVVRQDSLRFRVAYRLVFFFKTAISTPHITVALCSVRYMHTIALVSLLVFVFNFRNQFVKKQKAENYHVNAEELSSCLAFCT